MGRQTLNDKAAAICLFYFMFFLAAAVVWEVLQKLFSNRRLIAV